MANRRENFIATYLPYAQEASAITGIDPGVILAQAAHETAWGHKAPGNNFFGIKGGGQTFATHEYIGGRRVNTRAGFRRYDDPRESFLDWARLMQTPRYAGVLAAKTPEEQIKALKAAGYATDPSYVSKLNNVRNQVASIAGPGLISTPSGMDVSGIMDVASLNDGTSTVPDQPTTLQGYVPDLGQPAPAQVAIADMLSSPPLMPPQWASATGFPIDEALTGRSAEDVLMGGPRADPRRIMPASGPIGPDMGSMRSPEDVLAAGPRLRPPVDVPMPTPRMRPEGRWMGGGAPDASQVPNPVSRLANGVTPPPPLSAAMPNPPMRPGGAPDAGMVPTPPERASGLPAPRMRLDINDPSLSFNAPPYAGGGPTSGPPPMPALPPMVAGRPGFPGGGMPASSRQGDLSAAMGGPPQLPDPFAGQNERMDAFQGAQDSRFLAREMGRNRAMMEGLTTPPPSAFVPPEARMKDDIFAPPTGPAFSTASPGPTLPIAPTPEPYGNQRRLSSADAFSQIQVPPGWQPGGGAAPTKSAAFTPPSDEAYRWFHGASRGYTGENGAFPELPPPQPPAVASPAPMPLPTMAQDQFNISFSPGGPADILDPSVFASRGTSQGAISDLIGSNPAAAIGAIPLMPEGFDANKPSLAEQLGINSIPSPANWAAGMDSYVQNRFPASVFTPPTPMPGQPGISAPMDIRSPIQKGGSTSAPPPLPPPPTLRQTNAAPQKKGLSTLAKAGIGGAIGGPLGAAIGLIGGGLFGGGGGGLLSGFGTAPSFAWSGGGTALYGNDGSTNYQKGTSNALGGSNALTWTGSNGQPVTVVQDPWTGTYMSSF